MSVFSNNSVIRIAAQVATALFILIAILQILLAAGILPITMAWGGGQPVLTTSLRIASVAAAILLVLFLLVIRRRAGLIGDMPIPMIIKVLSWVITAFLALNTLGNLASASTGERILFGPLSFLLAAASLVVSASRLET